MKALLRVSGSQKPFAERKADTLRWVSWQHQSCALNINGLLWLLMQAITRCLGNISLHDIDKLNQLALNKINRLPACSQLEEGMSRHEEAQWPPAGSHRQLYARFYMNVGKDVGS